MLWLYEPVHVKPAPIRQKEVNKFCKLSCDEKVIRILSGVLTLCIIFVAVLLAVIMK